MKKTSFLITLPLIALALSCNQQQTVKNVSLNTELDSVSYAIGLNMAKQIENTFKKEKFKNDAFLKGYADQFDTTITNKIEDSNIQRIISGYMKKLQEEKLAKRNKEGEANKLKGLKFLEENGTKEGVKTTASGLQYVVLKEGAGDKPKEKSKVKVHYHGTLIDGSVFDSSVDRGEPSEFGLNQVIKGWTEGLQLMPKGAKYKFFIPSDLAYGANPRPGSKIKPNEVLIFEVELLDILQQ